eukprot:6201674-Pleurochrysis_carterae.AAC.1
MYREVAWAALMRSSSAAALAVSSFSVPYLAVNSSRRSPGSVRRARDSLPDGRVSRCPLVMEKDQFW